MLHIWPLSLIAGGNGASIQLLVILSIMFTIAIAVGTCLLAYRRWRCERIMGPNMFRPPEWPLIGVGPHFVGKDNEAVLEMVHKIFRSGPTPIRAWFGPILVIGVSNPDDMQIVLSSQQCLQKGYMYKFMHNETGLFTSQPDVWRQHRKLLNPTFSLKHLQRYAPIFNDKSRRMCDILEQQLCVHEHEQLQRPGNRKPFTMDVYHAIFLCTLDVTVNTVMSMSGWELQNAEGEQFHDAFVAAFECIASRMYRVWQIPDSVYRRTAAYREEMRHFAFGNRFVDSIIERKQSELATRLRDEGRDILEEERSAGALTYVHKCMLLWRQGVFERCHVRDEVETILIGGIDTTSVTVTHTILMLAIHTDVQQRCVEEMETVFGRRRWWNRDEELEIEQEDVAAMVYLKRVVHESLRLFPAGPLLSRMCDGDLELTNATIPSGSVILLLITQMHRDAVYWGSDAESFDPDRFLPERVAERHPWSFLPFSGGPRNCIGIKHATLSVHVMLTHLLRRFQLSSRLKLEDVRIKMDITSKVVNEDAVWLERRSLPEDFL